MVKTSKIIDPFFSHDFYPQKSKKIVKLIDDMGYEGYGLYWKIVEFMHCNELCVGEERLIAGKSYSEKVEHILNDFELFSINDDQRYYSERILRNISKQEEKSIQNKTASNKRWALAALKKCYVEIFEQEPVLRKEECKVYYDFYDKIENFKTKLPDILYTLKCLKFPNNPTFVPSINWLLQDDGLNMGKLINGQYGKLKSWQKHLDYLKQKELEELKGLDSKEKEIDINDFPTRESAIKYIKAHTTNLRFINPAYGKLIEHYKITSKDLKGEQ